MKAAAFVVGPRDGPGAALRELAGRLGFHAVLPFHGVGQAREQARRTPLLFFLFAAVEDPATLAGAASAIRAVPSRAVRFSPLIYFSESPSLGAIRQCIAMGFDDVLTLPFTEERVGERVARQVAQSQVYYETPSYFGPDRRRAAAHGRHSGRGSGGWHRRIEIVRTAEGINILREQVLT